MKLRVATILAFTWIDKENPKAAIKITDGGLPAKRVRLERIVTEIFDDLAGRFLIVPCRRIRKLRHC